MSKQRNVTAHQNFTIELTSNRALEFRKSVALDLSFQSYARWSELQKSMYITSLVTGMAPSKIIVANINECMNSCVEGTKDYEYYKGWLDQNYEFISIDGNNRTITIEEYLNDKVRLLHGEYSLSQGAVVINENNDTYEKHPKLLKQFIEDNVTLTLCQYTKATRSDLSLIFRNVNDGVKLNDQELRNAILVPYANWVRDIVQKYYSQFKNYFTTDNQLNRRKIDDFVVSMSVYSVYGASNGVSKSDKNRAYEDDSGVSKQTKNINTSISLMMRILKKCKHQPMKESSLFNFFMLVDYITKNQTNILDDEKFYNWFVASENRRLGDDNIILITPSSGEHRTYSSCCNTTSGPELSARYDYLIKDFNNISSGIVADIDSERFFNQQQRYEMWVNQKGICTVTGEKIPEEEINNTDLWHADHIIPHSKGGKTIVENGQLISKNANLKKSNKYFTELV